MQPELLRDRGIALERPVVLRAGVVHVGHFVFEAAALGFQLLQVLENGGGLFEHRPAAGKQPVLRQIAEGQVARADDLPLVGRSQAGEHLHQGGLAGPVVADQADAVALVDLEIERAEQPIAAKGLAQTLDLKHDFLKIFKFSIAGLESLSLRS